MCPVKIRARGDTIELIYQGVYLTVQRLPLFEAERAVCRLRGKLALANGNVGKLLQRTFRNIGIDFKQIVNIGLRLKNLGTSPTC
jgi:hypothetical protein